MPRRHAGGGCTSQQHVPARRAGLLGGWEDGPVGLFNCARCRATYQWRRTWAALPGAPAAAQTPSCSCHGRCSAPGPCGPAWEAMGGMQVERGPVRSALRDESQPIRRRAWEGGGRSAGLLGRRAPAPSPLPRLDQAAAGPGGVQSGHPALPALGWATQARLLHVLRRDLPWLLGHGPRAVDGGTAHAGGVRRGGGVASARSVLRRGLTGSLNARRGQGTQDRRAGGRIGSLSGHSRPCCAPCSPRNLTCLPFAGKQRHRGTLKMRYRSLQAHKPVRGACPTAAVLTQALAGPQPQPQCWGCRIAPSHAAPCPG